MKFQQKEETTATDNNYKLKAPAFCKDGINPFKLILHKWLSRE